MNLDTVVSILISVFRVHTFGKRSEAVCQFGVFLLFQTFFRSQFAFAGDVIQCFVDVYVAGCLIKQCTSGIQFSFHNGQHVVYGRELDNCFSELLAVFGIRQSFVVSSLAQSYRLCGDTQTGTVHQGHYVFDQTEFAVTAKFGFCILINQFAGRRTVNT